MASRYFTDADGYYLGSFWDDTPAPDGAIECEEAGFGLRKVGKKWVVVSEAEWREHFMTLEERRATWVVDRWQIKAVLGEAAWTKVVEFGMAPDAPWGLRVVIEDAQKIPRLSETVELLAWLLGMDAEQVDALFLAAMALRA